MPKSSIQPPTGEVVLIQKKPEAPVEAPKIREVSHKEYERMRVKKPLSEKQKENLAKLVEKNKQRAIERRAIVTNAVPEVVPEDRELVVIKPKRKYTRKPKNEVIQPSDTETATESESEPEVRRPVPLKRINTPKPKKVAPKKKVPVKYTYDTNTETTSNDDWSDDDNSDDEDYEDPRVQKYQQKAQARIQAVQQIDQRIQQLKKNPYENRNLGVF